MTGERILVVDDEQQIVRALSANLEARGYVVACARDGEEALRQIADFSPELVILDLGLPLRSGLEVLESMRVFSQVPVIIVSARTGDPDKIVALDAGADDYLTKPFSIGELLARVRAALRRSSSPDAPPVLRLAQLTIDLVQMVAIRDGVEVHLTPLEWKIVGVLVRNEGRLVTQRQLLSEVWGPSFVDDSGFLRVHMTHIRRKLEPEPARPRYFRTDPGIGYRFQIPLGEVPTN